MFLLKIRKTSEARLWMLCFHWWAATPRSNPTDLSWTPKICGPRISQASKVSSHGTPFINSGHFGRHPNFRGALNLPAFSIKAVHSSHLFESFSAKSFLWESLEVTGLQEKEFGQKYPQWKLKNVQQWNFCGRLCLPMKRGSELDP